MSKTVVCFGPGPIFKGGLSNYNTSLSKAFARQPETRVHIVSWSQQYPFIIPREFKDTDSTEDLLRGTGITCSYLTNYNNPFSWWNTAAYIASLKPDIVVFQWSLSLQGLPLHYLIKRLKKICPCEIIIDLHFVVQKEKSSIDRFLARMGIMDAHTYVVHAKKTYHELQELFPHRTFTLSENRPNTRETDGQLVLQLYHPIYDLYKPNPNFNKETFKKRHGLKKHVFLFFGFIRKYKGLHYAIEAFNLVAKQRDDVSLLVCGESFWNTLDPKKLSTKIRNFLFSIAKAIFLRHAENERDYNPLALVQQYNLQDRVVIFNRFISNEEVHTFFQASDCVLLFYLTATPSGIESLSYNFHLPILATTVGHFPETVRDGVNGYLAEANNITSMAEQMLRFLDHPIPQEHVRTYAKQLSWDRYAQTLLSRYTV